MSDRATMQGYPKRVPMRHRIGHFFSKLRVRLLESKAHEGLGGPPNAWQHSPQFTSRQHGMSSGLAEFGASFGNDAFDIHVWVRHDGNPKPRYELMIAAEDFRKIALWYLWRWAWGEVFGLRRKLYYWDLNRRLEAWEAQRKGRST